MIFLFLVGKYGNKSGLDCYSLCISRDQLFDKQINGLAGPPANDHHPGLFHLRLCLHFRLTDDNKQYSDRENWPFISFRKHDYSEYFLGDFPPEE